MVHKLCLSPSICDVLKDVAKQSLTSLPVATAADSTRDSQPSADEARADGVAMPDLTQMLPYKPQVNVRKCCATKFQELHVRAGIKILNVRFLLQRMARTQ